MLPIAVMKSPCKENTNTRRALHVLLNREIAMRQELKPRHIQGATLVRVAVAAGFKTGDLGARALGLRGDLQAIILRWGHSARSLQLSLTCCPERREIAAQCGPDVIADHISAAVPGVQPGVPPLVDVLAHTGALRTVSVDWLRAKMQSDYWFAYSLDRGGRLSGLDAEWLKANFRDDDSLSFALAAGGFLKRKAVTQQWLADSIRCPRVLAKTIRELDVPVAPEWAAKIFSSFHDFVTLTGDDLTFEAMIEMHWQWYRKPDRPPTDLALEIIELNHRAPAAVFRDVATVFYHLQGVPLSVMEDVIVSCDELTGMERFLSAHRRDDGDHEACERAIAAWGWHGDAATVLAVAVSP